MNFFKLFFLENLSTPVWMIQHKTEGCRCSISPALYLFLVCIPLVGCVLLPAHSIIDPGSHWHQQFAASPTEHTSGGTISSKRSMVRKKKGIFYVYYSTNVWECISIFEYMWIRVFMCANFDIYVYAYVYMYTYLAHSCHKQVHICVNVIIYSYMCLYMCLHMCQWPCTDPRPVCICDYIQTHIQWQTCIIQTHDFWA